MQQFRFGLQTLLRVRIRQEDRAKSEFGDQQRRVQDQIALIDDLKREQEKTAQQAKEAMQKNVDVMMEKSCAEYSQTLWCRQSEAAQKLEQLQQELEKRREALIQARQAVKILEKLREKKYAAYLKEAKREEQYFLDEVASTQHQASQGM